MRFFLKNTQTLIGSSISVIVLLYLVIYPNITQSQEVFATYGPTSIPNNKFGIHILSSTNQEAQDAAQLVNTNGGDWGYVTILIEDKNRDHNRWQAFFDELRRQHLIPIVRLATAPEGSYWKRPYEGQEIAWADFLDSLNWPAKNRYVVIYNEPNHSQEWGNFVDAKSYAETLDKTITALKSKNEDFFILNGGFDASAPQALPAYQDEANFLIQMDQAVPGIFDKLDGWASHSYPQPNFQGSPDGVGRGTIRTWLWEKELLRSLGSKKDLPIFITETGWKHQEGLKNDPYLPSSETVGKYFQTAFFGAFSSPQIVTITPFLLNYQEEPFDHFSFKKLTGGTQDPKLLGAQYPDYYPQYETISQLPKAAGQPKQLNQAELIGSDIPPSIVVGQSYTFHLNFKNTGQSIWNDGKKLKLLIKQGSKLTGQTTINSPAARIEPGQKISFDINLKGASQGNFPLELNLTSDNQEFENPSFTFGVSVKSPVILTIKSSLIWKSDFSGEYFLGLITAFGETVKSIFLDSKGNSQPVEASYLLPDHELEFSLQKPFYKQKVLKQTVYSGPNTLDFGTLHPDFFSALTNPKQLWQLTPFSSK